MKRKTFMSEELEAAGINVQYDAHAKRVLGSRQVLARILQGAAEEYRGYFAEEIGAWIEPDIHIASDLVRPGSGSADRMICMNRPCLCWQCHVRVPDNENGCHGQDTGAEIQL
nr:hypothetical protein [uncultured Lachnoclostridium sp.]